MRFKILGNEAVSADTVEVCLRVIGQDLNLEARVDGEWKLLAWVNSEGDIFVASSAALPKGFSPS